MRKKNSPGVSIPPEYRWLERTSYMLDEIALKTEHKDSIDRGKRSKTPS